MLKLLGLCYILTILIGAAAFSVHLTARMKLLNSSNRIVMEKSTTIFLTLVLIFNFCDFLILFLRDVLSENQIAWIYVAENILELALAYAIMMVSRDYVGAKSPRWLAAVFLLIGTLIFYGDGIYTMEPGYKNETVYAGVMAVLNMIPLLLQTCFVIRYFQAALRRSRQKSAEAYMILFYLLGVLLCVVATASIIDSRTAHDFIGYDKEIYIVMWLLFNVSNFVFIWRSCRPNEQGKEKAALTEEEALRLVKQQYALSEREYEIARLMFEGKNNKEMAELLYLSPNTVKVHASNLYRKLGAANRIQAVQILGGRTAAGSAQNTGQAAKQGA